MAAIPGSDAKMIFTIVPFIQYEQLTYSIKIQTISGKYNGF